jgi:hypothetical protein
MSDIHLVRGSNPSSSKPWTRGRKVIHLSFKQIYAGSSPAVFIRASNSVGRVSALQAEGRGFDPLLCPCVRSLTVEQDAVNVFGVGSNPIVHLWVSRP